ncbi:MAG: 2-C-methyl-D-erythritol 2,4-cyclodiphosphate synthase [Planctomycetes bacterium]|nr:2-C-methyl-D-erythritol 2,4-cyclodiphosphate synthase [Planctomycetota bacterium]
MSFEANYEYRTGIGTDIHRLVPNRQLVLGGVEIAYPLGLLAHSDGDVVLHAVIDAIMGAMAMGDIGTLFPDSDPQWKDADSSDLLFVVSRHAADRQWEIVNLDVIVHAEEPRLQPHKQQMKRTIASVLGMDFNSVNVKAKTSEGLGDIGAGQAISATVITLLRRRLKRTL